MENREQKDAELSKQIEELALSIKEKGKTRVINIYTEVRFPSLLE